MAAPNRVIGTMTVLALPKRLLISLAAFALLLAAVLQFTVLLAAELQFTNSWMTSRRLESASCDETNGQHGGTICESGSTTVKEKQQHVVPPIALDNPPLYGPQHDSLDNEALFHPHAGARFENGTLGLVVNPDPARMMQQDTNTTNNNRRPFPCPEPPLPGIEGPGGLKCLKKIREGLLESRTLLAETPQEKIPRILCMVYTYKANHDNLRAIARTWAKDCDGFFAASTVTDHSIGAIHLLHKGNETYDNMWQKVRSMWAYAHDYYFDGNDEFDAYYIGGDDVYVAVDNLRAYLLSEQVEKLQNGHLDTISQRHQDAQKWATVRPRPLLLATPIYRGNKGIYPSGGPGYTLNRAALDLFGTEGLSKFYVNNTDSREDAYMGGFFQERGIYTTDTRDEKGAWRYMIEGLETMYKFDGVISPIVPLKMKDLYKNLTYYPSIDGVSSQAVSFHLKDYGTPAEVPNLVYRYHELLNYNADCEAAEFRNLTSKKRRRYIR
jgi:hypothetical protein